MEIIEFKIEHIEQVKDLLVELQEYIVEIDKFRLNIISQEYREEYFNYMCVDVVANDGKVYLAIENNKVLGFIAGHISKYEDRDRLDYLCPKKGIVAELIVNKDCRKGGVGNKLLSMMEKYFKSMVHIL